MRHGPRNRRPGGIGIRRSPTRIAPNTRTSPAAPCSNTASGRRRRQRRLRNRQHHRQKQQRQRQQNPQQRHNQQIHRQRHRRHPMEVQRHRQRHQQFNRHRRRYKFQRQQSEPHAPRQSLSAPASSPTPAAAPAPPSAGLPEIAPPAAAATDPPAPATNPASRAEKAQTSSPPRAPQSPPPPALTAASSAAPRPPPPPDVTASITSAANPIAFSGCRSRHSSRPARYSVTIQNARSTGCPNPVNSAYPNDSATVASDAPTRGSRSRRAAQNTSPEKIARCIPETTSRWNDPVRSNPARSRCPSSVRSPVSIAVSIAASSWLSRNTAGNRDHPPALPVHKGHQPLAHRLLRAVYPAQQPRPAVSSPSTVHFSRAALPSALIPCCRSQSPASQTPGSRNRSSACSAARPPHRRPAGHRRQAAHPPAHTPSAAVPPAAGSSFPSTRPPAHPPAGSAPPEPHPNTELATPSAALRSPAQSFLQSAAPSPLPAAASSRVAAGIAAAIRLSGLSLTGRGCTSAQNIPSNTHATPAAARATRSARHTATAPAASSRTKPRQQPSRRNPHHPRRRIPGRKTHRGQQRRRRQPHAPPRRGGPTLPAHFSSCFEISGGNGASRPSAFRPAPPPALSPASGASRSPGETSAETGPPGAFLPGDSRILATPQRPGSALPDRTKRKSRYARAPSPTASSPRAPAPPAADPPPPDPAPLASAPPPAAETPPSPPTPPGARVPRRFSRRSRTAAPPDSTATTSPNSLRQRQRKQSHPRIQIPRRPARSALARHQLHQPIDQKPIHLEKRSQADPIAPRPRPIRQRPLARLRQQLPRRRAPLGRKHPRPHNSRQQLL